MADLQNTSFKKEIINVSSNYTVQNDDDNAVIIMSGDIDITLPDGIDEGWHAVFIADDADPKDFVTSGTASIEPKNNGNTTGFNTVNAQFRITNTGSDTYYLDTNIL